MIINEKTTFGELRNSNSSISQIMPFIQPTSKGNIVEDTIEHYCDEQAKETAFALQLMNDLLESNKAFSDKVYDNDAIKQSPDKEEVQISYFETNANAPLAIIVPGGGYHKVCTMLEGVPIAGKLLTNGFNIALLRYRTNQKGVLPKPLEDFAYALKHLQNKGISINNYIVVGFSAGGHLSGSWAIEKLGYGKYNLPKPKMLILGYPLLATWIYDEKLKHRDQLTNDEIILCEDTLNNMLGDYTEEEINLYSVDKQIDENYPPLYFIHSKNDELVDYHGAIEMDKKLNEFHVKHQFRLLEDCGHGFALSFHHRETVQGWMDIALDFYKNIERLENSK
ncbi:MAG: alpha/beta hydrolase [Erysipelotrichaceae bacterium]|nr:alpha/beta hydrolase [Erysipelotrichaceae bacterium]